MRGHSIGLSIGCGRGNGERIRSPADGGASFLLTGLLFLRCGVFAVNGLSGRFARLVRVARMTWFRFGSWPLAFLFFSSAGNH